MFPQRDVSRKGLFTIHAIDIFSSYTCTWAYAVPILDLAVKCYQHCIANPDSVTNPTQFTPSLSFYIQPYRIPKYYSSTYSHKDTEEDQCRDRVTYNDGHDSESNSGDRIESLNKYPIHYPRQSKHVTRNPVMGHSRHKIGRGVSIMNGGRHVIWGRKRGRYIIEGTHDGELMSSNAFQRRHAGGRNIGEMERTTENIGLEETHVWRMRGRKHEEECIPVLRGWN